jgi:hypothetical protein
VCLCVCMCVCVCVGVWSCADMAGRVDCCRHAYFCAQVLAISALYVIHIMKR